MKEISAKKPHAGQFGSKERGLVGRADPQRAAAARWSKDRRTVVELARQARPEAFATVLSIMLDTKAETNARLRAGELILAYSDGKPRQQLDLEVRRGADINELSRDALMLALTRAAEREGIALPVAIDHEPMSDRRVLPARKGSEVESE